MGWAVCVDFSAPTTHPRSARVSILTRVCGERNKHTDTVTDTAVKPHNLTLHTRLRLWLSGWLSWTVFSFGYAGVWSLVALLVYLLYCGFCVGCDDVDVYNRAANPEREKSAGGGRANNINEMTRDTGSVTKINHNGGGGEKKSAACVLYIVELRMSARVCSCACACMWLRIYAIYMGVCVSICVCVVVVLSAQRQTHTRAMMQQRRGGETTRATTRTLWDRTHEIFYNTRFAGAAHSHKRRRYSALAGSRTTAEADTRHTHARSCAKCPHTHTHTARAHGWGQGRFGQSTPKRTDATTQRAACV